MFFSDKIIMDNYIDVVVEVLSNKDVIATFVMLVHVEILNFVYLAVAPHQVTMKSTNERSRYTNKILCIILIQ